MSDQEYKSPNSGEPCTVAQYIAEILCTKEAKKKGLSLSYKFWNEDPWKKTYIKNIVAVNRMLKKYDAQVIFNALKRKELAWAYVLSGPKVNQILKEEQRKFDKEKTRQKEVLEFEDKTQQQPRKPRGSKNTISKLRELDGE